MRSRVRRMKGNLLTFVCSTMVTIAKKPDLRVNTPWTHRAARALMTNYARTVRAEIMLQGAISSKRTKGDA